MATLWAWFTLKIARKQDAGLVQYERELQVWMFIMFLLELVSCALFSWALVV